MMLRVILPCILCVNLTRKMSKLVCSFFISRKDFKPNVEVTPCL